jgi:hypothetical protein
VIKKALPLAKFPEQEPWDQDEFARLYNQISMERGGECLDLNAYWLVGIQDRYYASGWNLSRFVLARLMLENEM